MRSPIEARWCRSRRTAPVSKRSGARAGRDGTLTDGESGRHKSGVACGEDYDGDSRADEKIPLLVVASAQPRSGSAGVSRGARLAGHPLSRLGEAGWMGKRTAAPAEPVFT